MKTKQIKLISIILLVLISFFSLLEIYFKRNDFLNIFNNKSVVINLLKGFIPDKEQIIIDNFEIKVPYGYEKINNNTAIGLFSNIKELKNTMNNKYNFVDQFGSVYTWEDSVNKKLIFVYAKRYAKINYLNIEIKDM